MAPIILSNKDRYHFEKYLRRDTETGCLLWTGARTKNGYGVFNVGSGAGNQKLHYAHRVAWIIAGNELTAARPVIRHRCDNPPCVEPSHLAACTQLENQRDKAFKNRGKRSLQGLPFGVKYIKRAGKPDRIVAQITREKRTVYVGDFPTVEEAHAAAVKAKERETRKLSQRHPNLERPAHMTAAAILAKT